MFNQYKMPKWKLYSATVKLGVTANVIMVWLVERWKEVAWDEKKKGQKMPKTCFLKEMQPASSISSHVLGIQAQTLHSNLHVDNPYDILASKVWLHCFQYHHGISQVKINSKATLAYTNAANEFVLIKKINTQHRMTWCQTRLIFTNMTALNKAKIA